MTSAGVVSIAFNTRCRPTSSVIMVGQVGMCRRLPGDAGGNTQPTPDAAHQRRPGVPAGRYRHGCLVVAGRWVHPRGRPYMPSIQQTPGDRTRQGDRCGRAAGATPGDHTCAAASGRPVGFRMPRRPRIPRTSGGRAYPEAEFTAEAWSWPDTGSTPRGRSRVPIMHTLGGRTPTGAESAVRPATPPDALHGRIRRGGRGATRMLRGSRSPRVSGGRAYQEAGAVGEAWYWRAAGSTPEGGHACRSGSLHMEAVHPRRPVPQGGQTHAGGPARACCSGRPVTHRRPPAARRPRTSGGRADQEAVTRTEARSRQEAGSPADRPAWQAGQQSPSQTCLTREGHLQLAGLAALAEQVHAVHMHALHNRHGKSINPIRALDAVPHGLQ